MPSKSKFQQLLSDLDIADKTTKRVNTAKEFNHVKDNIPLIENANMMADLLFLPTSKLGYKYLFVIVDLATDKFDIQEIKNKEPSTILSAMQKCFARGIIKKPKYTLKTDSGSEFKGIFNKYLYDESILHKTGPSGRHSSLSNVESLNRQLGRLFNAFMNAKEKKTGKRSVNWLDFVPKVRAQLNAIREKKLPSNINSYEYPTVNDTKEVKSKDPDKKVTYQVIKPKFKVGQEVYRYLDKPRDALGKNQPTEKKREGDITFDNVPREILQIFTYAGKGALYRYYLEGLPNVSYTEAQLRRA
jgi:hypothetical protein